MGYFFNDSDICKGDRLSIGNHVIFDVCSQALCIYLSRGYRKEVDSIISRMSTKKKKAMYRKNGSSNDSSYALD